jgi:TRAP-type C4-dicarboxylate transport system substrate-binding protein
MALSLREETERCARARAWLAGESLGPEAAPKHAPEFVLKATGHPPPDAWVVRNVFRPAFEVLRRMSGGRIGVEEGWGGSAHPDTEGFAALADGRSDFAPCYTSWEPGRYPVSQLAALPQLFSSSAIGTAVLERMYSRFLRPEFERPGVLCGRLKSTGPYHLFSRRMLGSLAQLKGLVIGTSFGMDMRVVQALGATAVPLRSIDLLPAMLEGKIDAVSLADGSSNVFGVGARSACRLELGVSMMNMEYGLSARFHDSLPPELRPVLNDWLRAQAQAETQCFYGLGGAIARDNFTRAGCRFVSLDEADSRELSQRMHALTDTIAAELDGRGLPGSAFVSTARELAGQLVGRSDDDLMREAIEAPLWLLPGERQAV